MVEQREKRETKLKKEKYPLLYSFCAISEVQSTHLKMSNGL